MRNRSIFKIGYYFIFALVFTIILCFFVQWYQTGIFDEKPVTISSELESDNVQVRFEGINEYTDTWESLIPSSNNKDDAKVYTGATLSTTVENKQSFPIKNWELRQNIETECYLNKFWCGNYEVHQFRNGEELVEMVDSNIASWDNLKLDVNPYTDVLMIHLLPGDYLVYYPSEEAKETVVAGNNAVGFGCILYFAKDIDLSNTVLTYYNDRGMKDGALYDAIVVMLWILLLFTIIHVASIVTYRRTRREEESVTQAVINGLSHEYKTLWLINVKNKTIQLVRNHDDEDIKKAVVLARGFDDYDTSINYYINHYVDEKDRERVRKAVSFDSLVNHLSKENFFTVNYLHHPYEQESNYFQMAFTKANDNGKEANIVLAYRDIDNLVKEEQEKQRQLEEALKQAKEANKTKSIFLANMSHEIRTPINAILGMDTMILRESNEESVKAYAKDIKNASNTLLSLVNDILDFSKIESGNMELVPENYRLDSVVNDLINMVKSKAEEKNLEFNLELNPNTPAQLYGDEIRVKQVILNLLSNAVKYTKAGMITWIIDFEEIKPSVCKLKVCVKDTGAGIKQEDMQKIASPYMRFDESENRSIEGTGLGLNITKNLLEKMGGELVIESVYGEGSVFSFEIEQPMWGEEQIGNHLNDSYDEEEMPEKFHAPKADVLVVDDVEMNLIVVKSLLKRIEINPEMCLSGMEAIELAKQKKYDLILLDAMMPKMNGKETLYQIRQQSEQNKETPIVVLTANAVLGAREDYLAEGFTNYLSKPVNGQLLEDMIETYLPKEKLVYPEGEGFEQKITAENNSSESDLIFEELSKLDYLDVNAGISAAGGKDTYLNVCENFYETSASRLQMISDYYQAKNFENYAIQTHALKSSARLVGALELSELAYEMELAGKASDESLINQKTEQLMKLYEMVQQGLKKAFEIYKQDSEKQSEKKELSLKKLNRKLLELQELIDAYDFESAKALMKSFDNYQLPDEFEQTYNSLKIQMAEVDYEAITKEIRGFIEKRG